MFFFQKCTSFTVFLSVFSSDTECLNESYFDLEFNTSNDCFYLAEEELTFYKARETCVQHNMQLASVDSQVYIPYPEIDDANLSVHYESLNRG